MQSLWQLAGTKFNNSRHCHPVFYVVECPGKSISRYGWSLTSESCKEYRVPCLILRYSLSELSVD